MTTTDDLAQFLLARIAEDEAVARSATGDESPTWWTGHEETLDGETVYFTIEAPGSRDYLFALGCDRLDQTRVAHIARHDPARVLAECASKRKIIRLMREGYTDRDVEYWALHEALQQLALPHAEHPDFREEWRL